MKKNSKTIFSMLVVGLFVLSGLTAHAETIAPSFVGFAAGTLTYSATLSSGQMHAGDGFTIYDIYGFTSASVLLSPYTWTVTSSPTAQITTLEPVGPDDPALQNV